ncbi:MAG: DUF3825 domain-containing protein [Cyanobacteria bacterium P01_A01_bin.17]
MSSFFSAIAALFRRLFRSTRHLEETTSRQRHSSGASSNVGLRDLPAHDLLAEKTRYRPEIDPESRPETRSVAPPDINQLERQELSRSGQRRQDLPFRDTDGRNAVPAELRQLVYRATYNMPKQRMHAGQFGSRLRQADPTFSYEKYDFTKLIYLLEAVPDIVTLERVNNPGSAPAYYVRPVIDIRSRLIQAMERYDSEDGWVHVDSVMASLANPPSEIAANGSRAARRYPFSIRTYGFSQISDFLRSCSDLLEFKADNPAYVRLLRQRAELAKPKLLPSPKRPRTAASGSPTPTNRSIVHLSKFAGFSPQVLNQKVGELAAIALPERWYFGPQPPDNFAHPILKSYLRYTFIRLQHERKVIASANDQYRAFNTGMLDKLLRPIYALLSPSAASRASSAPRSPTQTQWDLNFCIPGEGPAGKTLVANFTKLPVAANYLSNPAKVFYHLSAGTPDVDWHHIIKDNMERLPSAFLAQYTPTNFTYRNTQTLSGNEFHTYKRNFAAALDADPVAYRNIVNRLEEALSRTLLKTQINYKTAVPTYYPNINSIDLLLPICLVTEDVADCAIVARQSDSGKYIGHTILTMRQAYNNARLICKLDEHWLSRAMTLSQEDFEEEEDDSEEFEAEDSTDSALLSSADSCS